MGQQWPAVGSEVLNTTVLAYALLKEVPVTAIAPTIVWPRVT